MKVLVGAILQSEDSSKILVYSDISMLSIPNVIVTSDIPMLPTLLSYLNSLGISIDPKDLSYNGLVELFDMDTFNPESHKFIILFKSSRYDILDKNKFKFAPITGSNHFSELTKRAVLSLIKPKEYIPPSLDDESEGIQIDFNRRFNNCV